MAEHAAGSRSQGAGQGVAAARADASSTVAQLLNASPAVAKLAAQRQILNVGASAIAQRRAAPLVRNESGLPDALKVGIESLSGIALDDVRVHRNSSRPAQLSAHAFAQGTDIHLAPGAEQHLPHEAWHVVQQKQGRVAATTQLKGTRLNDDASLEREADIMGARARHGATGDAAAPVTGAAVAPIVQRVAVETLGGTFNEHKYEVHNQAPQGDDAERSVGADMWLDFMPNAFVMANATAIGLVQTVKTLRSTAAAPEAGPTESFTPAESPFKAAYKLTEGDVGRGIDKRDRSDDGLTNTNPVYASDNHKVANHARYSKALGDNVDQPGLGQNWKAGVDKPARLIDRPRYVLQFANQTLRQTFEVVGLVLGGKLANTYLGSVEWGVTVDAGASARLDPASIRLVNIGIPSAAFMAAARAWNSYNGGKRDVAATEIPGPDAQPGGPVADGKVDVVKLPETSAGKSSPTAMAATADALIVQIGNAVQTRAVETETDKTNIDFAIEAMERRLVAFKAQEWDVAVAAWAAAGEVGDKPPAFDETSDAYVDEKLADATGHTEATRDKVKLDLMVIMI